MAGGGPRVPDNKDDADLDEMQRLFSSNVSSAPDANPPAPGSDPNVEPNDPDADPDADNQQQQGNQQQDNRTAEEKRIAEENAAAEKQLRFGPGHKIREKQRQRRKLSENYINEAVDVPKYEEKEETAALLAKMLMYLLMILLGGLVVGGKMLGSKWQQRGYEKAYQDVEALYAELKDMLKKRDDVKKEIAALELEKEQDEKAGRKFSPESAEKLKAKKNELKEINEGLKGYYGKIRNLAQGKVEEAGKKIENEKSKLTDLEDVKKLEEGNITKASDRASTAKNRLDVLKGERAGLQRKLENKKDMLDGTKEHIKRLDAQIKQDTDRMTKDPSLVASLSPGIQANTQLKAQLESQQSRTKHEIKDLETQVKNLNSEIKTQKKEQKAALKEQARAEKSSVELGKKIEAQTEVLKKAETELGKEEGIQAEVLPKLDTLRNEGVRKQGVELADASTPQPAQQANTITGPRPPEEEPQVIQELQAPAEEDETEEEQAHTKANLKEQADKLPKGEADVAKKLAERERLAGLAEGKRIEDRVQAKREEIQKEAEAVEARLEEAQRVDRIEKENRLVAAGKPVPPIPEEETKRLEAEKQERFLATQKRADEEEAKIRAEEAAQSNAKMEDNKNVRFTAKLEEAEAKRLVNEEKIRQEEEKTRQEQARIESDQADKKIEESLNYDQRPLTLEQHENVQKEAQRLRAAEEKKRLADAERLAREQHNDEWDTKGVTKTPEMTKNEEQYNARMAEIAEEKRLAEEAEAKLREEKAEAEQLELRQNERDTELEGLRSNQDLKSKNEAIRQQLEAKMAPKPASEDLEAKRREEEEAKRVADEAEAKRIEEEEAQRLEEEAAAKRAEEEAAEAEAEAEAEEEAPRAQVQKSEEPEEAVEKEKEAQQEAQEEEIPEQEEENEENVHAAASEEAKPEPAASASQQPSPSSPTAKDIEDALKQLENVVKGKSEESEFVGRKKRVAPAVSSVAAAPQQDPQVAVDAAPSVDAAPEPKEAQPVKAPSKFDAGADKLESALKDDNDDELAEMDKYGEEEEQPKKEQSKKPGLGEMLKKLLEMLTDGKKKENELKGVSEMGANDPGTFIQLEQQPKPPITHAKTTIEGNQPPIRTTAQLNGGHPDPADLAHLHRKPPEPQPGASAEDPENKKRNVGGKKLG